MTLDGPGTTNAFEAPRRPTHTAARAPFMILPLQKSKLEISGWTRVDEGSYWGGGTREL